MLISASHHVKTPAVELLTHIWEARYVPDWSSVAESKNTADFRRDIIQAASQEGRYKTAAKITERVVVIKCQMASLKAESLYSYIPRVVDFNDAKRMSNFALLIYLKLVEIYQLSASGFADSNRLRTTLSMASHHSSALQQEALSMEAWGMPPIEKLAQELEPLLIEFQQQHIQSKDSRTLGFLTTILNFCNELILHSLSEAERLLISPYFKFVEEQVALPWQRVCLAASNHSLNSPALAIVEQCLPQSQAIAHRTYSQLIERFPAHYSRRGSLNDPGVTHSCIRDLQMNQAYFWLSFLDNTLSPIRDEFVPLCIMVFPGIGVKWELIESWNQLLLEEISSLLDQTQIDQIRPYIDEYLQAFSDRRSEFRQTPKGLQDKAQKKAATSLKKLGQLHPGMASNLSGKANASSGTEKPSASNEVVYLQEKMAALEAELSNARKQINILNQ
ncbi:hypothetical protein PN498_10435 [Oscillatoria sp. CS-180]|uniref:hypothetical protein n=1 Tax=Oscillatoria sp. CS-180 TaxID=3021720 RepID=UPI00232E921D|nr:hypothetical protein [Oscillatoria sp. CS-180]MDB9526405.1 hypothetical protein [Oscillatoria sp. CS-180]